MTQESNITDKIEEALHEALTNQVETALIIELEESTYQIDDTIYRLIANYRDGFNIEALEQLYDSFFEKYDFIVGDWGHEKLRLRGFYQLGTTKVPKDQHIDFLDDYLKEYCNFGCAYFVLAKGEEYEEFLGMKDTYQKSKPKSKSSPSKKHRRSKREVTTTQSFKKNNKKKQSNQKMNRSSKNNEAKIKKRQKEHQNNQSQRTAPARNKSKQSFQIKKREK